MGLRAQIGATYGRSVRAGAWLFSNFLLVPANTTDMGVLAGSAYPELWLNAWHWWNGPGLG